MTATDETTSPSFSPRVAIQKIGTSLSTMVMPNLPALIAWGIITALFMPAGYLPHEGLAGLIGPMIHYLLPLMIANTGGRMVYGERGGVVAVIATMGVITGSDYLIDQINAADPGGEPLGQIHMFIGAMMMAPLAAWVMKKLDRLWEERIPAGFEMLVNLFSAGIVGFLLALAGFFGLAPIVNWLMALLSDGVAWLINAGLLPLVSILIEPAKIFFLNNAINHGVLTPLGTGESSQTGKSILFLLEANPGPGLGILLAFTFFGARAAKASAPGAAVIHFLGGVHEIYFPYVLMRPQLILAVIAGGMSGVLVNVMLGTGLVAPAAPGSVLAIMAQSARGDHVKILLSILVATAVSFAIASLLLKLSRRTDDDLAGATAKMESMKGKKSSVAGALTGADGSTAAAGAAGAAGAGAAGGRGIAESDQELRAIAADHPDDIRRIVFACDAGMGSSAMGASVLRKKVRAAGFKDVEVVNRAISNLTDEWDLVVTHRDLAQRAYAPTAGAIHVAVDNFMNSPRYEEIVDLLKRREAGEADPEPVGPAPADAPAAAPAEASAAPAAERAAPADGSTAVGEVDQSADAAGSGEEGAGEPIMAARSITLHGTATTAEEAITESGRLLVDAGAVDPDYVDAMHEREKSVSTFMGNGLAIPHGTNEAKKSIRRSAMSLVRYDQPVDWNGQEVEFAVAIAGQGDEHLTLLQNVAMVFSDPDQVERLRTAETEEEILAIFGTD